MFEIYKAATVLPQLQCASPAYRAFTAAAHRGALGYTIMRLCSAQPAVVVPKPRRPSYLRLVVDNESA
jgi:hypothetical protein